MSSPGEYDEIREADDNVLSKSNYRGPDEILSDTPSEEEIIQWTKSLTGFEVGATVSRESKKHFDEIESLYTESKSKLEDYAAELGVLSLNEFSPKAVLFMVVIRELQSRYVGKTNLNPHKFSVLQGDRYSVNEPDNIREAKMRDDVRTLQDRLLETELLCVLPGTRDTTREVYPAVKSAYPKLCDDDYLCSDVCDEGTDQPEWMHATRRVQQQLKRKENSRVERRDDEWFYRFPSLYLQPVSERWIDQFSRTVRNEVTDGWGPTVPDELEHELPTRIWGIEETDSTTHQSYIDRMRPGDLVLYYHKGDFIASGRVRRIFESDVIGDWLWNNPQSRWIYLITEYDDWGPDIGEIWNLLGYGDRQVVNGFMRVSDSVVEKLRREYGSLESAILQRPGEAEKTTNALLNRLGTESPSRRSTVQDQIQRNEKLVEELKSLYNHQCLVCGDRLQQSPEEGYSEVHHLRPLGSPHDGPDVSENMLVLCPNHHADFDNGMIRLNPETLRIEHMYDTGVSGNQLTVHEDHEIGEEYVKYHNSEVVP